MQIKLVKIQRPKRQESLWQRIRKNYVYYLFIAPFLLVFATFYLRPVINAIYYSFTSFNVLELPKFVGGVNFQKLFLNDDLFLTALKNTLIIAAIIGPVGYLLSLLFAWFINDFSPFVRAVFTLLFYAPSLSNIYVIWKYIFSADDYGIMNAYMQKIGILSYSVKWLQDEKYIMGVVIVILLWSSLGTSFLSFIAGFQNIDESLYEAAAVDGIRNRFQELWFITLPAMKPQLLFGAIMSISASFGVGDTITAVVGFPSPNYAVHTVVHHLQDYGFVRFEMGYACAIAVVLFVIMVLTNKAVQRLISMIGK